MGKEKEEEKGKGGANEAEKLASQRKVVLKFAVSFGAIFIVLFILSFSGFESYGPLVGGVTLGVAVALVNHFVWRHREDRSNEQYISGRHSNSEKS